MPAIDSILPAAIRIQGISDYRKSLRLDLADYFNGKRDPEIPPHRVNISGNGPFRALGKHNVQLCVQLGGLGPTDSILDLGCGIGRTALALTDFLADNGSYTGIDVIKFAVKWCRRHISKRHPNFEFTFADIQNKMYNPGGKISAESYELEFPAGHFTFCIATSLFTHLLPGATERYLQEVSRVLSPEGAFLSSWFLLDQVTTEGITSERSIFRFPIQFEHHAQEDAYRPEAAVAYQAAYVQDAFREAGLVIKSIHHGGWSGNPDVDSGQDIIVAHRAGLSSYS